MGLPFLLSLFPTILCFLASFLLKKYRIFGFIIAIILSDITRGNLLTGFPWNLPIHGFIEIKYFMNLLPNIGFYALNSMIILLSFLPAFLWLNKSNKKALFCILLCTLITLGFIILSKPLTAIKPKIETPIIMIQANISQHEKWQPESIERNFNRYLDMTSEAIKSDRSNIIIWPETAIAQYLLAVPQFNKRFKNFLASLPEQSILVTGFLNYAYDRHYNSLAVFDKTGEIIKMYDKHHLVPFGEYMPFGLDTITGFSNFYSGEKPVPIRIDTLDFNFLPLICYESIFQKYSYQAAKADFLINITNDSWFGNTAGPYQHFDHMILRAIETQKPALRLSGNGLSGYIHTDGNVSHKTFLNEKTSIIID
jgi:apolipoprotein N-acyltransferase